MKDTEVKQEKKNSKLELTTIFIVGSQSSGKTSIINRLIDKTEIPKPTLALDFTFARRTAADLKKEVCHIWELGGDAITFSQLIETPIRTNRNLEKMALFVVLDLSVPEKIWPTLETVVTNAKKAVAKALADQMKKDKENDLTQKLEEKIAARIGQDCQERHLIDPFPLPLVIIGTKYDVFQDFEPERRKTICRILRLASHHLGASLNFYSHKDVTLSKRVKDLMSHCAFDTPFPKGICQDAHKPLMIPYGSDSYEQIWPGASPSQFNMEFFRHLIETQIGKYNEKLSIPDDPAEDPNFREPEIDTTRNLILQDISFTEKVRKDYSKSDTSEI